MPILLRPSTTAARIIGGPVKRATMNNGVVSGGFLINSYDGPDSVYTPLTAADFNTLSLAVPDYFWPCQDASTSLESTIGSLTLGTNGTNHLYQQVVPSWTRRAVGSTADNDVTAWRATSGNGPDPTSLSAAWFGYFYFPSAPSNVRTFINVKGAAPQLIGRLNSTGTIQINSNAVTANGSYNYIDGQVHPIALVLDKAALTSKIYTDKEVITTTYHSLDADGNKGIGGVTGNGTCIYRCLYLAAYGGVNAQQDWRQYFQKLRWSLAY